MWGGALPGTVRYFPVVVENRKEVVILLVRVQHEHSHDEGFCTSDSYAIKVEICVVKNKRTKAEFSTDKKKRQLFGARSFYRGWF